MIDGVEIPDPASRWQPAGLRGPSRRARHRRRSPGPTTASRPPALEDTVIYELHVGTFTPEGTFEAAIPHLAGLRELGITTLELMPVAEFPGRHGWGYDGVYLSAAHSAYGGPQGLQRLVDAAHAEGLAVLLDVVYNHVGASGVQALEAFGPYFTRHVRDVLGPGDQLRRRRLRRRPRVGAAERRGLDPRLPPRRAAARRRSTRSSTAAPSTSSQALTRARARDRARARS